MSSLRIFLYTLLFLATSVVSAAEKPRSEINLDGEWQFQKVTELSTPPHAGGWKSIQVPGTLEGYNYERAWFKRKFKLPENLRGQRIKIRFDGVKYNSRVFVNGKHVGGCLNGYDAFEVDVTDAVQFGKENHLAVGCHDWTGVFSPGKFDFSKKPGWQRPRRFVVDKVIAPIGGHYDLYGIWGNVRLVAHPEVYVSNLFIKPSVRNSELVVDYTITNESKMLAEVTLKGFVEDQGQDSLTLPAATVKIPAGKSITKTIRKSWNDARYWSHEDPYLYHLRTELSTGDVSRNRFGFKEFWIEGHKYILNGSRVNLLATSWWPPRKEIDRKEIETQLRAIKKAGINCFRTHTQPWLRMYYEIADELGMLMIVEGAMWHDPYCTAYHDPTYWKNYETMIHAMIQREKNRASVIMWSMENESFAGKGKTELALKYLPLAGKKAKQWDPTRPIYFESDGDPGGVSDAIGLHYVHEYPRFNCWPNEAYWLEKPFKANSWYVHDDNKFIWKKKKPFYFGEFLWAPSGTPAPHTIFYGDEAYRSLDAYRGLAKAEVWKMQIIAFRNMEAGGMSPWTIDEGGNLTKENPLYRAHQYAYQPLAAFCLNYDRRFFSGETVERRIAVFNDILKRSDLSFEWTLSNEKKMIQQNSTLVSLKAGDQDVRNVSLQMPEVSKRTELTWRVILKRNGKQVFEETHEYSVFPKLQLPQISSRIGLYEPLGSQTASRFKESNIKFERIESLRKIDPRVKVLAIGPDAFTSKTKRALVVVGRVDPQRSEIEDFLTRGGRILILSQKSYPSGLFDVSLTSHKSTMTFPLQPSHPALQGLKANDLKFWRGDHMVTGNELSRPVSGANKPIVVSGAKIGLAHSPLLERPFGQGTIVHCQLKLLEKMSSEPAAGVIFGNLIRYLDQYRSVNRKTALLGNDADFKETLNLLRLNFDHIGQVPVGGDLLKWSTIICGHKTKLDEQDVSQLAKFVENGGQLLVHRPSTKTVSLFGKKLNLDLELQSYEGSVSRADTTNPLQEAIAREDLYWTVKAPGLSWNRQPMAQKMADGVIGLQFDSKGMKKHQVIQWKTEGGYVVKTQTGILFASNGSATSEVDFTESGTYGIGIHAKGTSCNGVYPLIQISIDGKPVGQFQIDNGEWNNFGINALVKKGRHKVTIAFMNDESNQEKKEDRNLEVDVVLIGLDQRPHDKMVSLTNPGSTAVIKWGKGRVVFDCIRWDNEAFNSQKAGRFACSLLTGLGADFTPPSAVTIESEQMTAQPNLRYFRNDGGITYMGTNGYLKTDIKVVESKTYTMELLAGGDSSEGIFPLVEIHIDGKKAAEIQLTVGSWRRYSIQLPLKKGDREFMIKFMNDHASPSGDRNLRMDKVVFYN